MKLLNESKIKHIFKGDQNLFWDALITDSAIAYHLNQEGSGIKFTPFLHDEKFGVPDQNLIHCLEKPVDSFFISEDYCDSAGDATYLNLDISYGLFYLPVIEETRLKEYYISPKSIARSYVKLCKNMDQVFKERCSRFGLFLDFETYSDLGFGEIPNRQELDCFFDIHPEQRISYLFSRAIGRFGIAPIKDNNTLISSIYINDTNMTETVQILFQDYLLRGLLEQSQKDDHIQIMERYHQIEDIVQQTKQEKGSIADLEEHISQSILGNCSEYFWFKLTRSSIILSQLETFQIKHFYLHYFIENNDLMSEIYNKSLNQTKMSIQRIRKGETIINLPFYINQRDSNNRYTRTELLLDFVENKLVYKKNMDYQNYENNENTFISGKAIPFLNEFRLGDHIIGLPEHGSKYSPACDAFIINARLNHIPLPEASILRISIHFLDQLIIAKDRVLLIPKILVPYFGSEITCLQFSEKWRIIVDEIDHLLSFIRECVKDGKESDIAKKIAIEEKTKTTKSQTIARFMDKEMLRLLLELTENYQEILLERSKQNVSRELNLQYRVVSFKIKLIVRYYMQQLLQVHDGLLYLNDRPYSIAIYLMFGTEFVEELIKNVTFRLESV
jgi:hypothetical protein